MTTPADPTIVPSIDVHLATAVVEAGLAAGLDRVGVATAAPFVVARQVLDQRKAQGLHGGMQFTYRNPRRSTEPGETLPSARALVVAACAYPATVAAPTDRLATRGPLARVARYAAADHYGRLRRGLERVAAVLEAEGWRAQVLVDDNALVDRAAAFRAGIGWYGKNANILVDGLGSWFVLGSVLTDAPIADLDAAPDRDPAAATAAGCGACTRCLTGCPTGAIVEPGVVDARRCLAWLVQAEGDFPAEHRIALGDRIYGCDECQEVCPPSIRTQRGEAGAQVGGRATEPDLVADTAADEPWVDVLALLAATDDELLDRHGRWYIPRRDPRYLRRNALVVLGNAASVPASAEVRAALERVIADADPMLRRHAAWAARRLGLTELLPVGAADDDPQLAAELATDVPRRESSQVRPRT